VQAVRTFVGHKMQITCLAFAPDGRTLFSGAGDAVLGWDVASGEVL
jgi:hypothetical protein